MNKFNRVLQSRVFWGAGILSSLIVAITLFSFTNLEITKNNLGTFVCYYEVITSIATVLLTGIVFGLTAYKAMYFSHPEKREQKDASLFHGTLSATGTFLSVLATGCPACSVTLATYLGVSSFLTFLPFLGYELRFLGLLITLFAIWFIWRNLEVCSIKRK